MRLRRLLLLAGRRAPGIWQAGGAGGLRRAAVDQDPRRGEAVTRPPARRRRIGRGRRPAVAHKSGAGREERRLWVASPLAASHKSIDQRPMDREGRTPRALGGSVEESTYLAGGVRDLGARARGEGGVE